MQCGCVQQTSNEKLTQLVQLLQIVTYLAITVDMFGVHNYTSYVNLTIIQFTVLHSVIIIDKVHDDDFNFFTQSKKDSTWLKIHLQSFHVYYYY